MTDLTYRIVIRASLRDALRRRFGDMSTWQESGRMLIGSFTADQATLRGVLTLLWEIGGEVVLLSAAPGLAPS
jgi:hypothetical protein